MATSSSGRCGLPFLLDAQPDVDAAAYAAEVATTFELATRARAAGHEGRRGGGTPRRPGCPGRSAGWSSTSAPRSPCTTPLRSAGRLQPGGARAGRAPGPRRAVAAGRPAPGRHVAVVVLATMAGRWSSRSSRTVPGSCWPDGLITIWGLFLATLRPGARPRSCRPAADGGRRSSPSRRGTSCGRPTRASGGSGGSPRCCGRRACWPTRSSGWMAYTLPVDVVPGLGGALYPVTFILLQLVTNVYYQSPGSTGCSVPAGWRPPAPDGAAGPGPAGGVPAPGAGVPGSDPAAQQQDDEHDDHDDHDGADTDIHRSGSSHSVLRAQPGG